MNEFEKQIEAAEEAAKEQELITEQIRNMTNEQLIMLMLGDLLYALEIQNPKPNTNRLAVIAESHYRTTV